MDDNLQSQYQDALDYLYSYVEFSLTHQDDLSIDDFNLASMRSLVSSLGNPQQAYPSIHVAGTKGKGSVCAFCATALQQQGHRVGLYTSPHLKDFEERMQINGEPISRQELVTLIDEIKPHVESIPNLTTFHITTALAFWYFARQQVDIAVIEVGLGGRLDSTNVITPQVSVITPLYLEHTSILGDTISKIAAEKGGIIKPGVPVVVAPQQDSASEVLTQISARQNAELIQLGADYTFRREAASLDGQIFSIWSSGKPNAPDPVKLNIGLLGPHQVENAAVAYVALQAARQQGIDIGEEAIQKGFARAQWPARFEVLRRNPPVVIDSAHAPGAVQKLQQTLDEFFPKYPIWLVLGISEDKDVLGMLAKFNASLRKIYCAQAPHPRAMAPEALAEKVKGFGCPVQAFESVGDALETAMKEADDDGVVLVTGSIFVAASGRIAWFERSLME